jgi:hypothetical protein
MTRRYLWQNIRRLLIEGFSDEELRDLCFDVPDFKSVYHQLAHNTGKAELVRRLLAHAEQRLLVDRLLALAETLNPVRYAAHQPYVEVINDSPVSTTSKDSEGAVPGINESPVVPFSIPPATSNQIKSPHPLRVFLSHSSGDKLAVHNLYHWLKAKGIDPWFNEEKLLPGQKWKLEIQKAVYSSDVVIVCLSAASINKAGFVREELL